jgi:mono/diheme cytochrome c family protein/plastocyanin
MTDTPGRPPEGTEPEPEQRLPAVREQVEVVPADRFTSPPSTRKLEFTPERAAQVVRQSANARWVGFLAVVVIILFVSLYWFYELGAPAGLTKARLATEIDAQQVAKVERGYNIYEANCARCHGKNGEGGVGPTLNRQDKLFAHLNEDYIRNVLTVGGRYVCGNPKSQMPVWSAEGNPPGPLNYRQVEELIAFLLAPSDQTFIVRDEHLLDPKKDPITGQTLTFKGWRDPNYKPAPGATPYPDCWTNEFAGGASASPAASGASGSPGASPAASGSAAPSGNAGGQVVEISASGVAFSTDKLTAPADAAFTLRFDNKDAGTPHNVAISDENGAQVFKGEIFPGPGTRDYAVPALKAGTYPFVCSVHPNMTGTLTAG